MSGVNKFIGESIFLFPSQLSPYSDSDNQQFHASKNQKENKYVKYEFYFRKLCFWSPTENMNASVERKNEGYKIIKSLR